MPSAPAVAATLLLLLLLRPRGSCAIWLLWTSSSWSSAWSTSTSSSPSVDHCVELVPEVIRAVLGDVRIRVMLLDVLRLHLKGVRIRALRTPAVEYEGYLGPDVVLEGRVAVRLTGFEHEVLPQVLWERLEKCLLQLERWWSRTSAQCVLVDDGVELRDGGGDVLVATYRLRCSQLIS